MTDDDDILAAEFALGLLDDAEADTVLRRAQADAALSLRIAWWRDQLAPMVREAEIAPREGLWPAIAARLADNDNAPRLMQRWRAAALTAMSVAAALLVFIGVRPDPALPPPVPTIAPSAPMVAMLAEEGKPAIAMIGYDEATGNMTIAPAALDPGAGDAELWVIPADGTPRSMGVIDASKPEMHAVPRAQRPLMVPGATFAVSFEPKGGSPTGAPTGPVMATGKISRV